jgi:DUF971 family protein
MRRNVKAEQIGRAPDIVVEEKHEVARSRPHTRISRRRRTAIRLLEHGESARRLEAAQALGGAIRRAVHDYHDFALARWKILREDALKDTLQEIAAIICRYND